MANIKIEMKDGTVHDFPHVGRAGGSATKTVEYEGGMVIVTDEWYNTRAFPILDVKEVKTTPHHW